eukprot:712404-Rhodomonas_salina.3
MLEGDLPTWSANCSGGIAEFQVKIDRIGAYFLEFSAVFDNPLLDSLAQRSDVFEITPGQLPRCLVLA